MYSYIICRTREEQSLQTTYATCIHKAPGDSSNHHPVWMEYLGQLHLEDDLNAEAFAKIRKYLKEKFKLPGRNNRNDMECYDWNSNKGKLMNCQYGIRGVRCKEGFAEEEQGKGCRKCPAHSSNNGSARRCSCDLGYYHHYNLSKREWECKQCRVDTYGAGGVDQNCTTCPEGRSTLNIVGVKSLEGCCDKGTEVESFGKCVNKFILPCCISAALVVVAVLLACSVRIFRGGKHARLSTDRVPKCGNASRKWSRQTLGRFSRRTRGSAQKLNPCQQNSGS